MTIRKKISVIRLALPTRTFPTRLFESQNFRICDWINHPEHDHHTAKGSHVVPPPNLLLILIGNSHSYLYRFGIFFECNRHFSRRLIVFSRLISFFIGLSGCGLSMNILLHVRTLLANQQGCSLLLNMRNERIYCCRIKSTAGKSNSLNYIHYFTCSIALYFVIPFKIYT